MESKLWVIKNCRFADTKFDYHKTLAKEMWAQVLKDGKELFKTYFDTENDNDVTEPFRLKVKECAFVCQAFAACGDWQNPVLYYRCQLLKKKPGTSFESFGTDIMEYKDPFFVFIPKPEDGNPNLKKSKGKYHATDTDGNEQQEISERKGRMALKEFLAKCISSVPEGPSLPSEKKASKSNPPFETLKKNKKKLTDEERDKVMKAKAVWHHGPNGEATPAVWKSDVKGDIWYVTNTHRAFQARKSLEAAINIYHDFIKSTASRSSPTMRFAKNQDFRSLNVNEAERLEMP